MQTECIAALFEFPAVEGRRVVASFDGGAITSDSGALLLGQTDRAIRLTERFAACFADMQAAGLPERRVATRVMPRAGEAGPGGLLLLPAALHFLRPASAGGQAPPCERRRRSGCGGGGRPHRGTDPSPLAKDPHSSARGSRLHTRGPDDVVRG